MPYTYEYPRPAVTVDAAVFRKAVTGIEILLIKRGKEPYKDMWALPGGFVNMDETLEEAIARELEEETGLIGIDLKQMYTFSTIHRDPRHRTISTVYFGMTGEGNTCAKAGDDAADTNWFNINELPLLAFDHNVAVKMAIERINKPGNSER
jgi:8-oxo-dGTP diphosphatase